MNVKLRIIASSIILAAATVHADDEAANRPVVRSAEYGSVYAKSVPAERYGQKGKTSVFGVGANGDTLICEYDWYSNDINIGGAGESTLVRFGPWQRGRKPQKDHLALGIYRDGKTVREYSTAEMEKLGSGVSQSVSHYTVFQRRLGFRWVKGNTYVYEVEGVSGKVFSVDTHGLTPVALAAEDDSLTLRVSAPSDSRERSAFTHGLTPVVLSGALIELGTGLIIENTAEPSGAPDAAVPRR